MMEKDCHSLKALWESRESLAGLYRFNMRLGLKNAISGLSFPRCFEYMWTLRWLGRDRPLKVLDLGPWRSPLPLFLASCGHVVTVIDLPEGIDLQRAYFRKKVVRKILSSPPLELVAGKLPELPFEDGLFDVVTGVSTIEHLPGDGDIQVVRESARVLKPGGRLLLTVPCRASYEEGQYGRWFERRYDRTALHERLVEPSALSLAEEFHLYDRRAARFAGFYWKVPSLLRNALGWSVYFIAGRIVKKNGLPTLQHSGGCLCLEK